MEKLDFEALPLDDLWALHERISNVLSARMVAQKQELEQRLFQLTQGKEGGGAPIARKSASAGGTRQEIGASIPTRSLSAVRIRQVDC